MMTKTPTKKQRSAWIKAFINKHKKALERLSKQ